MEQQSPNETLKMYSTFIGLAMLLIAYGGYSIISDITAGFNADRKDFGAITIGSIFLILDLWKFGWRSFPKHFALGGFFVGIMFSVGGLIHLISGVTKWGRTVEPSEAAFDILIGIILLGIFGFVNLFVDQINMVKKKNSNQRVDLTR